MRNFICEFLEYDLNNNSGIWRSSMRIRVRVDVRKPLKRWKRVRTSQGDGYTVHLKYEQLGVFCFICGCLGHSKRFCDTWFTHPAKKITRAWGGWLRAQPRRSCGQGGDRWLRDNAEDTEDVVFGKERESEGIQGSNDTNRVHKETNQCNNKTSMNTCMGGGISRQMSETNGNKTIVISSMSTPHLDMTQISRLPQSSRPDQNDNSIWAVDVRKQRRAGGRAEELPAMLLHGLITDKADSSRTQQELSNLKADSSSANKVGSSMLVHGMQYREDRVDNTAGSSGLVDDEQVDMELGLKNTFEAAEPGYQACRES